MTWQDANTYCQSLGARLAILDTPAKLDVIFNGLFTNFLNLLNFLFLCLKCMNKYISFESYLTSFSATKCIKKSKYFGKKIK